MNIKIVNEPFAHILIENSFTKDELKIVHDELDDLLPSLQSPEHTNSAKIHSRSGIELQKKNIGKFVDGDTKLVQYAQRFFDIICEKYNLDREQHLPDSLLSYYKDGDYYKAHKDMCVYSVVTFLCKDNSKFTGGQLSFPKHEYLIEPIDNTSIIFPSNQIHEVLPINLTDNTKNYGRFSLTTFVDKKPQSTRDIFDPAFLNEVTNKIGSIDFTETEGFVRL